MVDLAFEETRRNLQHPTGSLRIDDVGAAPRNHLDPPSILQIPQHLAHGGACEIILPAKIAFPGEPISGGEPTVVDRFLHEARQLDVERFRRTAIDDAFEQGSLPLTILYGQYRRSLFEARRPRRDCPTRSSRAEAATPDVASATRSRYGRQRRGMPARLASLATKPDGHDRDRASLRDRRAICPWLSP